MYMSIANIKLNLIISIEIIFMEILLQINKISLEKSENPEKKLL